MFVDASRAVDPDSKWAHLGPVQRLASSAALGLLAWMAGVHGLAALFYGWYPVFLVAPVAEANSFAALVLGVMDLALASAWLSHLWQRHAAGASRTRCEGWRDRAYKVAIGCFMLACPIWWVMGESVGPNLAFAGRSDVPLLPLPWVWRWFHPLAGDRTTWKLWAAGVVAVIVILLGRRFRSGRAMSLGVVGVLVPLGAAWLGVASDEFGASRGLLAGGEALRAEFLAAPGRINASIAVWWWAGWGALAGSAIMTFVALRASAETLRAVVDSVD